MNKSFVNHYNTMPKNAAVLTVVCLLLCLSFNYTFPLHRERTTSSASDIHTHKSAYVQQPNKKQEYGIVDRTKKLAAHFEHALMKIIDAPPDKDKNKNEMKCSHAKLAPIDSDLSNYEQLVIMKKYPYLDLQELDFNLHPNTNAKQSLNSAPNMGQDSSFCDSGEDRPFVEISNRGLSGFAIPTKISQSANPGYIGEYKINSADMNITTNENFKTASPPLTSRDDHLMESLEEDIREFEKHLGR